MRFSALKEDGLYITMISKKTKVTTHIFRTIFISSAQRKLSITLSLYFH